jgi:hypothetical protein
MKEEDKDEEKGRVLVVVTVVGEDDNENFLGTTK